MSASGIVTVYATFGSAEEARRIARAAIEEGCAACANIIGPVGSIYRWRGAVEEAEEHAALFKTSSDAAERLIARIGELHSYDVPAAVVWPIAGALPAYAAWVQDETKAD